MSDNIYGSMYDYSTIATKLKKIEPFIKWDDIEEEETYHIPPILCYRARDFKVISKEENALFGIMKSSGKVYNNYSLFKNEISVRFLIKKWSIGNKL